MVIIIIALNQKKSTTYVKRNLRKNSTKATKVPLCFE